LLLRGTGLRLLRLLRTNLWLRRFALAAAKTLRAGRLPALLLLRGAGLLLLARRQALGAGSRQWLLRVLARALSLLGLLLQWLLHWLLYLALPGCLAGPQIGVPRRPRRIGTETAVLALAQRLWVGDTGRRPDLVSSLTNDVARQSPALSLDLPRTDLDGARQPRGSGQHPRMHFIRAQRLSHRGRDDVGRDARIDQRAYARAPPAHILSAIRTARSLSRLMSFSPRIHACTISAASAALTPSAAQFTALLSRSCRTATAISKASHRSAVSGGENVNSGWASR
jgi:hypothetical protein